LSSAFLEQALNCYSGGSKYKNETARAMFKLGLVKMDNDELEAAKALINEATASYHQIRPGKLDCKLTEKDFDGLVMSWSR
jgi:hypothetical protein